MERKIRLVMDLQAPRDRVWEAWTTGPGLASWLCNSALVVPVVGGAFDLFWQPRPPDPGGSSLGQLLFADRPRLLELESQVVLEGPEGGAATGPETRVRVQLVPTLAGLRLELDHEGWPEGAGAEAFRLWIERRWCEGLERLRSALAGQGQECC